MSAETPSQKTASVEAPVPKISIQFCIQCKWNLRAAYYAQELLQTFSTSLGEVALRPATGGIFTITLETFNEESILESYLIWDRKRDGGFPETKELKKKVRDIIDPKRDLGHVDGHKAKTEDKDNNKDNKDVATQVADAPVEAPKETGSSASLAVQASKSNDKVVCEDCQ
ncbi:hypothetical protein ABW19_dt0208811 [Dactylella cylindrospora]|nr:hypothetical protein ABW19_dt0208811 [Dactylella cylindrospora]